MIAPNVRHDIITGTHDAVLKYGDKVLEVADEPLPSSAASPIIDALRKQPPSGLVRLKILRDGTMLTLSAACSDARPYQMLIEDALTSASTGDFGTCTERLTSAQKLHELDWLLASVRIQCGKRVGRLSTSDAQAMYDVDRQAIAENAAWPEDLERLRAVLVADETTLGRMGASALATRIDSEFEAAENRRPSEVAATHAAKGRAEAATGGVASPAAFDLKGITLGGPATPAEVEQKLSPPNGSPFAVLKVKCGIGAHNWQVCNGMTSVADVFGQLNLVIDEHGIVQRINVTFPEIGFAQVQTAVVEKLGSPAVHNHQAVQNRMGANFDNEYFAWKDTAANFVILQKYAGDIERSILSFTTQADRDASANSVKEHSGDL
ncbi:MAG TPA: hypothetical protein VK700_02205 [Steroidobacteraceae bacterium]|nr:hypothetical protein [Steroidobacteraceae bacterium]